MTTKNFQPPPPLLSPSLLNFEPPFNRCISTFSISDACIVPKKTDVPSQIQSFVPVVRGNHIFPLCSGEVLCLFLFSNGRISTILFRDTFIVPKKIDLPFKNQYFAPLVRENMEAPYHQARDPQNSTTHNVRICN